MLDLGVHIFMERLRQNCNRMSYNLASSLFNFGKLLFVGLALWFVVHDAPLVLGVSIAASEIDESGLLGGAKRS